MSTAAALIYWAIVALWLAVLTTVCVAFFRNPRTFGTTRLLLSVIVIDSARNIIENLYFGLYFGAQYGLFSASVVGVLGNPAYLILPKVMNVIAAAVVLGLLMFRWLPSASRERAEADADLRIKDAALLAEAEERRRVFETSLDLILITDRRGFFQRVSPSSLPAIGYAPEEMVGRRGAEFIYPTDLEATRREMHLARTGKQIRNFETRYDHKSGRIVPLAWSGVWSEPEQRFFFFGRDMTERKLAEDQLRHLALFDQLTGLPNRASLHIDVRALLNADDWERARTLTLAAVNLDRFKDINDTLGHPIGDRLLVEIAKRLKTLSSEVDVYRLSGNDFVLVLANCGDPLTPPI